MIAENVQKVQERVAAACARANRDPASITLIAVSKRKPASAILEAVAAGLQHFGENRVEEAQEKIPEVLKAVDADVPLTWHMIGHIQSRKAKHIPPLFNVIHSLDSVRLAVKLTETAQQPVHVLMQVNISGEESKSGFNAVNWSMDTAVQETLWQQVRDLLAMPNLQLRGLMTMAPIVDDIEQTRPVFRALAELRQALSESLNISLPELSMGMTDDYPIAIEEGATMIRIGRAIFGERE